MKGITGYVLAAVVLTLVGFGLLTYSMIEREMAGAQERVATFQFDGLEETLDRIEPYYEYGSRLPWVGNGPLNDVRARKAAVQYWQRQYAPIVPQQTDPIGVIPPDNLELQLVVADAAYRVGRAKATDRAGTLQAIKSGMEVYLAVLRNATRNEVAAYNYEFLTRLRDDMEKRRLTPPLVTDAMGNPFGEEGGPPPEDNGAKEFKILVPLENDEIGDPGKLAPLERKG